MIHKFVSVKLFPIEWLVKLIFPQHSYPYNDLAFVDIFSLNIYTVGNHLITDELYKEKLKCINKIKTEGRIKYLWRKLWKRK